MNKSFTNFEAKVFQSILSGEHPILSKLRSQIESAKIDKRENSEVGFFLNLTVPEELSIGSNISFTLGNDVLIKSKELKNDAGVILFIKDGLAVMLECFTYGELWPDRMTDTKVNVIGDQNKKQQLLDNLI